MSTYIPIDLRRKIINRAANCCEYCQLSQSDYVFPFHVDHIISEKHGGETKSENLALSCPACNMYKGSNIAAADTVTDKATFLFHPRKDNWEDHFILDSAYAVIKPLTAEGRVTVFLLRMNNDEQIKLRHTLILLERYPCFSDKEQDEASQIDPTSTH